MPTRDYRITLVLDFTVDWDDDTQDPDVDFLHDAVMDHMDTVDLEWEYEHIMYDTDGEETDETFTVHLNCDNVREVEVADVTAGGSG